MKITCLIALAVMGVSASIGAQADGKDSDTAADFVDQPYLLLAASENRQDRRQERGRSDERQDKRDCRQEEGRVGKDKRECKQEEVRDGVRGNRGGDDHDDSAT